MFLCSVILCPFARIYRDSSVGEAVRGIGLYRYRSAPGAWYCSALPSWITLYSAVHAVLLWGASSLLWSACRMWRYSRWRMRANPRFALYAPGEGAAVIGRERRSLGSLRGIRIEYAGSIAEFWGRMGKPLLTYRQSSHLRFWFHITRTGKRMACPLHEMLPLLRRKIIDAVRNSKDRFALRVPPHFRLRHKYGNHPCFIGVRPASILGQCKRLSLLRRADIFIHF